MATLGTRKTANIPINPAAGVSAAIRSFGGGLTGNYGLLISVDGWDATEAVGIQLSDDGTTWYTLQIGATYPGTPASPVAGVYYWVTGLPPFKFMRFFSHNGSGVPSTQTAARVITYRIVIDL